jgi:outer membrane biosynthesis protein TonB
LRTWNILKNPNLLRVLALLLFIVAFLLACRTAQLLTSSNRSRNNVSNLRDEPTETPTRARARPTATQPGFEQPPPNQPPPQEPPTSEPPPQIMPTDLPPPVDQEPTIPPPQQPDPLDDSQPGGASAQVPANVLTPVPNANAPATPSPSADAGPTRCPQTYCVVYRGCETDSGNTIIEGYVYNNGVPENGIPVRVALDQPRTARPEEPRKIHPSNRGGRAT